MVKLVLTAAVSPLAAAVSVYVPGMLILQLEKLATPDEVLLGLDEQLVRAAPPVGGVIARVMGAVLEVLVLPPASWMATRGCAVKEVLTAVLAGTWVKPSWTAGPTVTVKLALSALVSPLEAAVNV
jgi:hypothetical protein